MEDPSDNAQGTPDLNTHVFTYSEAETNRLLGPAHTEGVFLSVPSAIDLKHKYEYETKRYVTLELHLITLIEYHRHQRIPRGLRAQSRPNLFSHDIEFRTKFEQISNKYAFDTILLNIEFLRKELQRVNTKKDELHKLLTDMLSPDDFEKFSQRNDNFLLRHKTELQDMKRRTGISMIINKEEFTTGLHLNPPASIGTNKGPTSRHRTPVNRSLF